MPETMTPETPVAATTPADSAPVPDPAPGVTPEAGTTTAPEPDPAETRIRDAQRRMHAATQEAAKLRAKLAEIMGPVPRAEAPAGVPAGAPVERRPETVPTGREPVGPFTDEEFDALYQGYTSAPDDKAAVKMLTQQIARGVLAKVGQAPEVIEALMQRPELLEQSFQYTAGRAMEARKVQSLHESVEGFWKEQAPHIPTRLLWTFAQDAQGRHPGDLSAQALYCLERGLSELGAPAAPGTSMPTPALLPGSGAPRPASSGGAVPSFVDQLRQARARERV